MKYQNIAVLGAGTIGLSWAALFAATGRNVTVYDPASDTQQRLTQTINNTSDTLKALGWNHAGDMSRITFTDDPVKAVKGADLIQESIPERLQLKHDLYASIEPELKPDVIIGTSTSGLKLSELQKGFKNPGRIILAHPFNPPHLIPLLEVMENELTDNSVLQEATKFYESIGKVCVKLNKEITGHIANRIQAAVWREAINLAQEGVASVEDVDKAIAYGPGLRWGVLGPTTLFHLGGGAGGVRAFCEHLGDHVESWWNDLGSPDLTPEAVDTLEAGMQEILAKTSAEDLIEERDRMILQQILTRKKYFSK